jgi:alkylphosphonate utilization operon protein PhnA
MSHYYCPGCDETLSEIGACESDGCANQWEMMLECECSDDLHGKEKQIPKAFDSNQNELSNGDTVVLIKDLTLRGTSQKIKQGTKVPKIRLTDNPEEVDCKIDGSAIVLRTEFLKKI